MNKNLIDELKEISLLIAHRKDWVQGAGGNTSVKQDDTMLIKASGTTLNDVVNQEAFVAVNNRNIMTPLLNEEVDITNEASLLQYNLHILNSIIPIGQTSMHLVPSMETSFHSLFYRYTIHTHNVYANLFLCSDQFELLEKCFTGNEDYTISLLGDYYTPGTELSWHIWNQFRFEQAMPNVLFMPNHGVIYSANQIENLILIHNDVEEKLAQFLGINSSAYPTYDIKTIDPNHHRVNSIFLTQILDEQIFDVIFNELLFPDQAIYIRKEDISFSDDNAKLYINQNKDFIFKTNLKEAMAIIEIMLAFYFLYREIKNKNWEPLTINFDWHKLTHMQSEQYRKSLIGK